MLRVLLVAVLAFAAQCNAVEICRPGSSFDIELNICVKCPVGYFSAGGTITRCSQCPIDRTTLSRGSATSVFDCVCPMNHFQNPDGKCQRCPHGTYAPVGSTSSSECNCALGSWWDDRLKTCTKCNRGFYGGGGNSPSCSACPMFQTTNHSGAESLEDCYLCTSGYFHLDQTKCIACPIGSYTSNPTHQKQCELCGKGKTTLHKASTDPEACVCEQNSFLDSEGLCEQCPVGALSDAGSVSFASCQCPFGTFLYKEGDEVSCSRCPKGTYGGGGQSTECTTCPEFTTTLLPGASESRNCSEPQCAAGYFTDAASTAPKTPCHPCAVGFYSTEPDTTQCLQCPKLKTTLKVATSSEKGCICQENHYTTGSGHCVQCPEGSSSPKNSSSIEACKCKAGEQLVRDQCIPCPVGYFSDEVGACTQCPEGTSTESIGSISSSSCSVKLCKPGTFVVRKKDKISSKYTESCEACPVGKYASGYGQNKCQACVGGQTTLKTHSTSERDCVCPQNTFLIPSGKCENCPVGSTSEAKSTKISDCECKIGFERDENSCKECQKGFYGGGSSTKCLQCAEGETTLAVGSIDKKQCLAKCKPGSFRYETLDKFSKQSITGCRACPLGTYSTVSEAIECRSCPTGMTTIQEASSEGSACICTANSYMNSDSSCLRCPYGMTSPAGSSGKESCICRAGSIRHGNDCIECPIGTFFIKGECAKCPTGLTTVSTGSILKLQCSIQMCSEGQYLNKIFSPLHNLPKYTCEPCSRGFYTDEKDSRECQPCPEGLTTLFVGAISRNHCTCPMHQYIAADGACHDCPAGSVSPPGASWCICKRRGYYLNNENNICDPCPIGTYGGGLSGSCKSCPKGLKTLTAGASEAAECK